jgi:ABC-2 type transport system ATP-binding protein
MDAQPVIETDHLSKHFGENIAVADLSLQVERGEVFGFLGPNGAGKTTSMKMLLGLISPTGGEGCVLGAPLGNHQVRRRLGFLPEHFRFHEWLTAGEFLHLHADLYSMEKDHAARRIQELLELVELKAHTHRKLRTFSKGMLQRIGLAQALLNDPEVVFLDEPTSGLDPMGRRLVRDITRDLRAKGTTVFLNSHFLSEVEVTCDRVAFIKGGVIVRTGSLDALMNGELHVAIRARNLAPESRQGLTQWCRNVQVDGDQLTFQLDSEDLLPQITRYLIQHGADLYTVQPQIMALEDLFLEIIGEDEGSVSVEGEDSHHR